MKDKLIDQQWVDIVQPSMAHSPSILWWMISAGLFLLAGLGFYFLYYQRATPKLRRYLRYRQKLLPSSSDYKMVLHQLERQLCIYLGIANLAQRNTVPSDWRLLLESLMHYRYQKGQPSIDQASTLLSNCLQLLDTNTHCRVE